MTLHSLIEQFVRQRVSFIRLPTHQPQYVRILWAFLGVSDQLLDMFVNFDQLWNKHTRVLEASASQVDNPKRFDLI